MHYLEAWNEAVCDGAWGPAAAVFGEKLRQALDLEHWAAFGESLERMMGIVRAVGTGERGEAPASIVALSGDVHHAYLAEVGFPPGTGMSATAWQATCSPFRNPLDDKERTVMRFMASEVASRLMRALAGLPHRRVLVTGAIGIVQEQQVEVIHTEALQRALGRGAQVVRVGLGAAQGRVGEAREALGALALSFVDVVADRAREVDVLARCAGDRAAQQLVGLALAVGVGAQVGGDAAARAQQLDQAVFVDGLAEAQKAAPAPGPEGDVSEVGHAPGGYARPRGLGRALGPGRALRLPRPSRRRAPAPRGSLATRGWPPRRRGCP